MIFKISTFWVTIICLINIVWSRDKLECTKCSSVGWCDSYCYTTKGCSPKPSIRFKTSKVTLCASERVCPKRTYNHVWKHCCSKNEMIDNDKENGFIQVDNKVEAATWGVMYSDPLGIDTSVLMLYMDNCVSVNKTKIKFDNKIKTDQMSLINCAGSSGIHVLSFSDNVCDETSYQSGSPTPYNSDAKQGNMVGLIGDFKYKCTKSDRLKCQKQCKGVGDRPSGCWLFQYCFIKCCSGDDINKSTIYQEDVDVDLLGKILNTKLCDYIYSPPDIHPPLNIVRYRSC